MQAEEVLREALDQYVANQGEYVETNIDGSVTDQDREKLAIASTMLDALNAAFVARLLGEAA